MNILSRKVHIEFSSDAPAKNIFVGILVALLLVIIIRLATNTTPPAFDAMYYLDMAQNGIQGNTNLAAPFAYRPAVPMIVGEIYSRTGLSPADGFAVVATVSTFLLLVVTFLFVLDMQSGLMPALCSMAAVALSFYHVKYPLYFSTMIDVEAYVVLILALWALLRKKFAMCLVLSSVGIFFKEFLLIPPILMLIVLLNDYLRTRNASLLKYFLLTIVFAGACFAIPRMLISIPDSKDFQEFHKFPESIRWRLLLQVPLDYLKDLNISYAWMSYWLPTLLLMTPERTRYAWRAWNDARMILYVYLFLVLLFTMYGGTNISIFVTYAVAAQALIIAAFVEYGISVWEAIFVLGAMLVFNRIFWHIPSFTDDFYGNVEMYGGWSTLITPKTLYRFLELTGYVAAMSVLRRVFGYYRRNTPEMPPARFTRFP